MYLLDTDVLSATRRPALLAPRVAAWLAQTPPSTLFLSSITILEVDWGVRRLERRDPAQGATLRRWLERQVLPAFGSRILTFDVTAAQRCAALHVPDPKPERDAMIASTALVHGLTVVTRNATDFSTMGVQLLNPWEA